MRLARQQILPAASILHYSKLIVRPIALAIVLLTSACCSAALGLRMEPTRASSEPADSVSYLLSPYSQDSGPWVGLRTGFEANGGPLGDRWTFGGFYELRSPNAFSVVLEYHLWRQRFESSADNLQSQRLVTFGILDLGFKVRVFIRKIKVSFQGGIGTGISISPFSLHYGAGVEIPINRDWSFTLNQKRYDYPEIGHFFFVGMQMRWK